MTVLDPPKYGPRYVEALAWAAELHRDQGRKSAPGEPATIPYLAHLLEVSSLVWLGGGDEDQAIAGLLHDAVEDTDAEARHVAGRFGERVADLVVACSEASPSGVRDGSTWLDRKLDYLIALYLGEHADALLVTAADKVSNARAIVDDLLATAGDGAAADAFWSRFNAPRDAIAWYYVEVHDAIATCQPGNALLGRLTPLVAQIVKAAGAVGPLGCVDDDPAARGRAVVGLELLARAKRVAGAAS